MKCGPFSMLLMLLVCSCVHSVTVGKDPISKRIVASDGRRPVSNALIWAIYTQPGGISSAKPEKYLGPFITDSNGYFHIPPHPFRMTQTGTIFDGDTEPHYMIVHRSIGAFSAGSHTKHSSISWMEGADDFATLDVLPAAERIITDRYMTGKGR